MKRTIDDIDVKGKKILLRVDFNVPLDESGNVVDASRITAELPTIKNLLSRGARLIICSHLGRPKGEVVPKYSLIGVAKYLIGVLNCKIKFSPNAVGDSVKKMVDELADGQILILENIRFYKEEEENDPVFATRLAGLADIYIDDAFGTAHRKHASNYGVAKLLPNGVGYLMGKEINTIASCLENPEKPFVAILGGAKVSDKLKVVHNLIKKCDIVLIGGGMAYTFLKAQGKNIGKSLYEESVLEDAKQILEEANNMGVKIYLPVDHMCGEVFSPSAKPFIVNSQNIPDNLLGLDIGKKTAKLYSKIIKSAKTVIWNGPMGVFEFESFQKGTRIVAKAVSKCKGKTIVGGGDSIAAVNIMGLKDKIYHVSTGGGASMQLIAGEMLPGVEVISEK